MKRPGKEKRELTERRGEKKNEEPKIEPAGQNRGGARQSLDVSRSQQKKAGEARKGVNKTKSETDGTRGKSRKRTKGLD